MPPQPRREECRRKRRSPRDRSGSRDAELTLLARRLNAMESIRDEYSDYLDGTSSTASDFGPSEAKD